MVERRFTTANGVRTLVTESGEGNPLLCLHGWGASHESWGELREELGDEPIRLIAPDLPGCGESAEPPTPWNVDDYVQWLEELLATLLVTRYSLLGHSHGGRIAIAFAAKRPPGLQHLYLCAAAGVGRELFLKRTFWPATATLGKALLSLPGLRSWKPLCRKYFYTFLGVHDYERATDTMKRTMAGVLDRDLTPDLDRISVPTDIFWGEEDSTTPLAQGELLNKKIVQSRLHVFPGVRHRVHRDRAREIAEVIQQSS